eukprot:scaffold36757_cov151-Skeletonema_marinoi.AAC.2
MAKKKKSSSSTKRSKPLEKKSKVASSSIPPLFPPIPPPGGNAAPQLPPPIAYGNVHAGGAPQLPPSFAYGNVHDGGAPQLPPPFGNVYAGGAAISYPPQYGNQINVAALPLIVDSNEGVASSYPPIGDNNALDLDYCDNNGSDMKNWPDDHKFDDDDDDDDDNVKARARANSDYYRRKVRGEGTGHNKFKNFLLTYAEGGNKSPIICYVGWKENEAVGEYPYQVFWLEYTDGDTICRKVNHSVTSSKFLKNINATQVSKSDPLFEARDHLKMYHIHQLDNPPQFDQREALRKHVKEEMGSGDFVALTLNQSDDSVEDHKVTDNRNKKYKNEINGNTYKVFHLKSKSSALGELLFQLGQYNGFRLKSAGKDRCTYYSIYRKD